MPDNRKHMLTNNSGAIEFILSIWAGTLFHKKAVLTKKEYRYQLMEDCKGTTHSSCALVQLALKQ